nr:DUF5686 family protein [uncultured Bacteroides sp.]
MKHYIIQILLFVCFFTSVPHFAMSTEGSVGMKERHELVDSILNNILRSSAKYEKIVESYDAELYIKKSMQVKKKNFLLHFAPLTLKGDKRIKNNITESLSELHFSAPNIYDQKVKALYGNSPHLYGPSEIISPYFKVNIYSPSLLYDKLLSPLAPNAKDYYTYKIDSVFITKSGKQYKILIIPKNGSYQLVRGYMIVNNPTWRVSQLYMQGTNEYMRFNVMIWMGKNGNEKYLPVRYAMGAFIEMLGNVIDINYTASLKYSNIRLLEDGMLKKKKHHYNLSDSFSFSRGENVCINDSVSFSSLRHFPLSEAEKILYRDYTVFCDSSQIKEKKAKSDLSFWGQMGDFLLNSYTINSSSMGSLRCSPIINPFLVSYSHNDGFSYRQDFKYNRLFADDRLLRVVPNIGYNFKHSEFYWKINSDYDYWPEKRASIHLSIGNGNRIYSSKVVESIKGIPDSLFNFDELHLDYFKDLFLDFNHSVEILNGLFIKAGVTIHQRDAVKPLTMNTLLPLVSSRSEIDALDGLKSRYVSFAPRLQLIWTPGQFYYLKGKRKVNLYSKFPTFSLDYERGLKGVMTSTGQYERIEFDMQHHISLGLMRDIYYRVGTGAFTNTHELYFVDYANLSKHNLPVGWNDDIGGVFQLLDSRWYNSSNCYIRAHFTYQAPFLLLSHLRKYTRFVINERIYASALSVPHLNPYIELGYGIGTHVFDAGVFVSYAKTSFKQIGCKFTFELFNR